MRTIVVRDNMRIPLGKQGENNAVRVVWPKIAEKYAKLYGDGRFELVVMQKGKAYPAVVSVDGTDLVWNVLAADVATAEVGSLELIYYAGDTIAKSQTWETMVIASKSADGMTEPPEDPAKSWFAGMQSQIGDIRKLRTESKDNLVSAINEVKEDIVQPNWRQNDPSAKDYVQNRTHWIETVVKSVISEQTVTTELHGDKNGAPLSISDEQMEILLDTLDTEKAPTFSVVLDGVKYNVEWVEDNGNRVPVLGNFSLVVPVAPDTGEPFVLSIDKTGSAIVLRTAGTYTLSADVTYSFAHRLPMQYSPVIIQDEDNPLSEVQKLVMSWTLGRVLTVDYDENKKQLTLGANTNVPVLTYYAVPTGRGYQWSDDAVGKRWRFQITPDYDLRQYIGNNEYGCSVLFREFIIDGDKYDVWLQLCINGLTGSFVTLTGAVYTVCINFNATSVDTRFDQKWTMTIKRIH